MSGEESDKAKAKKSGNADETLKTEALLNMLEDLNEAKKKVEESESQYKIITENATDHITLMKLDTTYIYLNPANQLLGYAPGELIGKKGIDFLHPDDRKRLLSVLAKYSINTLSNLIRGKKKIYEKIHFRFPDKSGKWHDMEGVGNPVPTPDGKGYNILLISRDITEQKKVQEALKESQERYKMLVENIHDIVCSIDIEGRITYISPQIERYGFKAKDIISKSIFDLIIPEDRKTVADNFKRFLKDAVEYPTTFRSKDKKGNIIWFEETGRLQRDSSGKILGITEVIRDITERARYEQEIKNSEEKFRSLYTSMNEGMALHDIMYDKKGKAVDYVIKEVNPQFERITGIKSGDIIGKKASVAYKTEKAPYLDIYAKVADTGKAYTFETYFSKMDKYFFISAFSPSKGRFATVFTDITERKNAEDKMRKSEKFTRDIIDHAGIPIVAYRREDGLLIINNEFLKMTGYALDEINEIKKLYRKAFPSKTVSEKIDQALKEVYTGKSVNNFVIPILRKDNSSLIVVSNITPLYNDEKKIIGEVMFMRDLSEIFELEDQIRYWAANGFSQVRRDDSGKDIPSRLEISGSHRKPAAPGSRQIESGSSGSEDKSREKPDKKKLRWLR